MHLTKSRLKKLVMALMKIVDDENTEKKNLFATDGMPILLSIVCIKIPKVPTHQMRILLPHSLVSPEDDVALFVNDLQRGRRRDYEPTVEHYQDLLRSHNCKRIKEVIPMNQVKTEFNQFELKRKLFNLYDHFLVDGRISSHLAHLLGKQFSQKRKLPTSIRMDSKNLNREIDIALRKTNLQIHGFGDCHIVQIGTTKMDIEEIVENLRAVVGKLREEYPGGWKNIRSLWIKTTNSMAVPVYANLRIKNKVLAPVIKPKRPKAYKNVEGELTTLSHHKNVVVTPDGDVTIKVDEEISDSESEEEET